MAARPRLPLIALAAVLLAASACTRKGDAQGRGPLRVAGAADLVFVMEEIIERFEKETGEKVDFIPGSSGKLAAQIRGGAPYDVLFSANVAFVDDVVAAGACTKESQRLYARGRIVLWSRPGAPAPPATLEAIATAAGVEKIAIAQPDHAPYGAAAKQALEKLGLWSAVSPKLIYGSNIKETMQMAETGNAEVAIIALSLAIKSKGNYAEIPEELHRPIDQGMAVCVNGKRRDLAEQFDAFMRTPGIIALMESYGFTAP
jgi:molybdate transport system substrate-binding protein